MLEKQRPHLQDPGHLALVDARLRTARLAHAYALREEGRGSEARRAYLQALRTAPSAEALRGWIATWLPGRSPGD